MSALGPEKLSRLTAVLRACPRATLDALDGGLCGATGPMAEFRALLNVERRDRAAREAVFEPLAPLFGTRFPRGSLAVVWDLLKRARPELAEAAAAATFDLLPGDPTPPCWATASAAAARLVREQAQALFPDRPKDAEALAERLELTSAARDLLARKTDWFGRPDAGRAAPLKRIVAEAVERLPDAAPVLIDIVRANLNEPSRVLRLISALAARPGDAYLAGSELADVGESLLSELEARLARLRAFEHADGLTSAKRAAEDLRAICLGTAEFHNAIELSARGPWGKRVAALRRGQLEVVETLLRRAPADAAAAFPVRVTLSGRAAQRFAPDLAVEPDAAANEEARAAICFLEAARSVASVGGWTALCGEASERIADRVEAWVDPAIVALHSGEAPRPVMALELLELAAELLGAARGEASAKATRRRAATAASRLGLKATA